MTASDRFDQRVAELFDDVAAPTYPDYFDDVLTRATAQRQRPAWTFPERWLPMTVLAKRLVPAPTMSWRTFGLVALIGLLLAAIVAVSIGTQRRVPAPFGPAGNGAIAYARDGDIYSRPNLSAPERLLIGGPEVAVAPFFSLDGTKLAYYVLEEDAQDRATLFVAAPDGSNRRALLGPEVIHSASWSPGSDRLVVIHGAGGRSMSMVRPGADSEPTIVDLGSIGAWGHAEWRPPSGDEVVFQGLEGERFAIFAVGAEGGEPRRLTELGGEAESAGPYALSPDGGLVAYTRVADTVRIHVVDLVEGTDREFGAALPRPAADLGIGFQHHGFPVFSPDGTKIVFGRYWDERDDSIYEQAWVGSIASDGADAVSLVPPFRGRSGHNPYWYTFSPDQARILVALNESPETWSSAPYGGGHQLEWGQLTDPPAWQRTLP